MGCHGFFVQAEHDSLPPHALDKLVTKIRSIGDRRLSLHKILSLDGCSTPAGFAKICAFTYYNYTLKPGLPNRIAEIIIKRSASQYVISLMLKIRVIVIFHSHIRKPLSANSNTIQTSNTENMPPINPGAKLIELGPPR